MHQYFEFENTDSSYGNYFNFFAKSAFSDAFLKSKHKEFLSYDLYQNLSSSQDLSNIKLYLNQTHFNQEINRLNDLTPENIIFSVEKKLYNDLMEIYEISNSGERNFIFFISKKYMIKNLIYILRQLLQSFNTSLPSDFKKDDSTEEFQNYKIILDNCSQIGLFPELKSLFALDYNSTFVDLYNILEKSPLESYIFNFNELLFEGRLLISENNSFKSNNSIKSIKLLLNEGNFELFEAYLEKLWIEDFHNFCSEKIGGETFEHIDDILGKMADRKNLYVILNSLSHEYSANDRVNEIQRKEIFINLGEISEYGIERLYDIRNENDLKEFLKIHDDLERAFNKAQDSDGDLEMIFENMEIEIYKEYFIENFSFAPLFCWVSYRMKENQRIKFICECIKNKLSCVQKVNDWKIIEYK